MSSMHREPDRARRGPRSVAITLTLTLAGLSPASAAPPAGQTYFTILLGLSASHEWEADCLKFTAGTVCTSGSLCGTWQATGADAFSLSLDWDEDDNFHKRR